MKIRILITTLAALLIMMHISHAQNTYIPDDNFEKALIDLGYDSGVLNDLVPTSNISSLTYLNISFRNITDLTGIKDFTALETLYCSNNLLTTADFSSNQELSRLSVDNNRLTEILLNSNPKLRVLECSYNQLTGLNLASCNGLVELRCIGNHLITLDVSANTELQWLTCQENNLTELNLQNGNNSNSYLDARDNPDLFCIQVDNVDSSYTYMDWYKNPYTGYSLDCSNYKIEMTYIPDNNFEQALIDLNLDFKSSPDDSIPTISVKYLKGLNLDFKNIEDLTGLENFLWLEYFSCIGNELSSLNLTANEKLKILTCQENKLTEILFGNNSELVEIACSNNQIASLNVHGLTNLERLFCYNNNLVDLNLENNRRLTFLEAYNNQLTSLNLKNGNNDNMTIDVRNENLFCIEVDDPNAANKKDGIWLKYGYTTYVENCNDFKMVMAYVPDDKFEQELINQSYDFGPLNDSVPLAGLQTLKILRLGGSGIKDLIGLSNFESMEYFECPSNPLENIDLSSNKNLKYLDCRSCYLDSLDLSNNRLLETVFCSDNNLTFLDLTANDSLAYLICKGNYLQNIDLSSNKKLRTVDCSRNALTNINIQNRNNDNLVRFYSYSNLPACILVDNVDSAYNNTNWIIDSYSGYSPDCSNYKLEMTYIPDDNFEQYFINNKYDIGLNDSVPTKVITTMVELSVGFQNISDLTGIEKFTSLERLFCPNNFLTELDLTNNPLLESVYCPNNQLTSLILGEGKYKLHDLDCTNNKLENINISMCSNLNWFRADNNQITSLDLSPNTNLTLLSAKNNQLSELNLQNGINQYMEVNVRDNPNLTCIQVDNANAASKYFFWYKDDWASYSVNCTVEAESALSLPCINLYPNPVDDKIFIDLNNLETTLTIFNLAGIRIYEEKAFQTGWLNVKDYTPGVYIFRFKNKNSGILNKKVIIE